MSQDLRESTLKTETGKIRAAMAIDLAGLAGSVSAYLLSGCEPCGPCDELRSAGRSRQPVDVLPVVMASDTKSGHLEGVRRPACT